MKDTEVLPCGCIMRTPESTKPTGTYIPCRKTCGNYHYMLHLVQEQNKPVTYIEAP